MSWVKIDDKFPEHLKVTGLSDAAFRLFVSALCYANRQETDGFIPRAHVPLLIRAGWRSKVAELVTAGLWLTTPGGFGIHDYLDYQPSHEHLEGMRRARADAGRRGGLKSGEVRRTWQTADLRVTNVDGEPGSPREAKLNTVPVPVPVHKDVRTLKMDDAEFPEATAQILEVLATVPGYVVDPIGDSALAESLLREYAPHRGIAEQVRAWATYTAAHPLDGRNPRHALVGWMKTAARKELLSRREQPTLPIDEQVRLLRGDFAPRQPTEEFVQ